MQIPLKAEMWKIICDIRFWIFVRNMYKSVPGRKRGSSRNHLPLASSAATVLFSSRLHFHNDSSVTRAGLAIRGRGLWQKRLLRENSSNRISFFETARSILYNFVKTQFVSVGSTLFVQSKNHVWKVFAKNKITW